MLQRCVVSAQIGHREGMLSGLYARMEEDNAGSMRRPSGRPCPIHNAVYRSTERTVIMVHVAVVPDLGADKCVRELGQIRLGDHIFFPLRVGVLIPRRRLRKNDGRIIVRDRNVRANWKCIRVAHGRAGPRAARETCTSRWL